MSISRFLSCFNPFNVMGDMLYWDCKRIHLFKDNNVQGWGQHANRSKSGTTTEGSTGSNFT